MMEQELKRKIITQDGEEYLGYAFGAEKEAKGRKEGLAAGEHGAQCKMARRLLARGQMTPGEVAELTELPLAEVEEIAKGISA